MRSIAHRNTRLLPSLPPESPFDGQGHPKWFALYTNSRHEKRVAQYLREREIEFFLPLYQSEKNWRDGSRGTQDLPLFPSYIFVRIQRRERARVLQVPGTISIVGGTGREPSPLPDEAIEALRAGLLSRSVSPHPLLTVGQRCRICSGFFAGMEGVVTKTNNRCRVVLTIDHIQQSMAVDIEDEDVELLQPAG